MRPRQPAPRQHTRADALHREAIAHAARGVVAQLRRAIDGRPTRQIGQLVRAEMENIAQDAVSFWIVKRCEQWRAEGEGQLDAWILRDKPDVADLL